MVDTPSGDMKVNIQQRVSPLDDFLFGVGLFDFREMIYV